MVLAWGTLRHPHATSTEIPTAQMRAVSRFTYKGLQNPALVSQAAELEVKAAQLREEDYRRELSSQGECLEQRATQMDRLGKVRDLGHCIETTGFRVGRRTSTPICVQRCVTVQTLASPVMTAGRGDFTGSPYNAVRRHCAMRSATRRHWRRSFTNKPSAMRSSRRTWRQHAMRSRRQPGQLSILHSTWDTTSAL